MAPAVVLKKMKGIASSCLTNGKKKLGRMVSPQPRSKKAKYTAHSEGTSASTTTSVAATEDDEDDEFRWYADSYNIIDLAYLSNADIAFNVLTVEYMLNPNNFPFLHKVDMSTVSFSLTKAGDWSNFFLLRAKFWKPLEIECFNRQ